MMVTKCHDITCNMWAMCGTALVNTTVPGAAPAQVSQVRVAPNSGCHHYHTFLKTKLAEHPGLQQGGSVRVALQWAIDR